MNTHPEYNNLLRFDLLCREQGIEHFSTTRVGGVSEGTFASFNLGNFSDDDPVAIFENRSILARMWYKELSQFIVPHQTHGSEVFVIDEPFMSLGRAEKDELLYGIDATITPLKNIFLCVTTADCVPILLYDKKTEVIAGIHAGWRGSVARIVEKTVSRMQRVFNTDPVDIIAGIGPAISLANYEVGEAVVGEFLKNGFDLSSTSYRKNPSSKAHIDLKEINRLELIRLGVPENQIEKSDYCTFGNANLFFSARRQTVHCGRMLTGIMLK